MKQLLTFLLLLCSYILGGAQATTLRVDNKVAGTLSQRILYDDKLTVENLTIIGEINADDMTYLKELNSEHSLVGVLDLSGVNIVSGGRFLSYGSTYLSTSSNTFNTGVFPNRKRFKKIIIPQTVTTWKDGTYYTANGSAGSATKHQYLNTDSLIIDCPNLKSIDNGIGNPIYLYVGNGVETLSLATNYLDRLPGASDNNYLKANPEMFIHIPESLKNLYGNSRMGAITVNIWSKIQRPDQLYSGSNKWVDQVFAKGIVYAPNDTKEYYEASIFKNLEIVAPISVKSIDLSMQAASLKVGETMVLKPEILPADADNQVLIWSSSDNAVASVDNGMVSAISGGNAIITATSAENPDIKAECVLTVTQPVIGIKLSTTEFEIIDSNSKQLIANVLPENASNKSVTWTSSDISVAMVSPDGTVYAIKPGQATIMATTVDGGFVALCKVTVKAKTIQISNIELTSNSESISVGETLQLNAIISPENASNKTVNWTSTNPLIASVNASGLVTAIAEGKTQIIATTTDGSNLSAICEINVNKLFITISQIQITPSNARITVGQTLNLRAAIAPDDATNKAIKWSSTNPAIATVSESGVVSAISEGNAIIIASTQDGSNLSATCQVEVYTETILVETINLNPMKIEGAVNDTYEIAATVLPTNATNKSINWKSSDESIVTVDDGSITLHALGTAIITAEAMDGSNVKSECSIIVSHDAGIDSIIADKESYVKVFNLSGYLIYEGIYSEAKLAPGFYIVLCNGASYKTKVD